jgi:hypothetical protein
MRDYTSEAAPATTSAEPGMFRTENAKITCVEERAHGFFGIAYQQFVVN